MALTLGTHRFKATIRQFELSERFIWLCGSFAPPLILLLSIAFTLDGFENSDKYFVVGILLGVLPLLGALVARWLRMLLPRATDFICINLSFTLLGLLWLGLSSPKGTLPLFNAEVLGLSYFVGASSLGLIRGLRGPAQELSPVWITLILVAVTPVLFIATTIVPADWLLAFDQRGGAVGILFAVGTLYVRRQTLWPANYRTWRWLNVIAVLVGPLLMMNGELDYDALHYTAYLGPATAVTSGRVPLIDVFCQYGQSYLLYVFALGWLPWTYGSAALVTSVLNVLYTACFLVILRRMVSHQAAFFVLALSLPVLFWLSYHYSPNMTPSQGAMRYLPVTLLSALLVWLPAPRLFSAFSVAAIFLCWAWSFEAAVYGSFIYAVFAVATIAGNNISVRTRLIGTARFLIALFALLVGFALLVSAVYLVFAGELPRYDLYIGMILAYVGPDPFMEYTFYKEGFLGWVPVLVMIFPVACWLTWQFFVATTRSTTPLPQFAVLAAITSVISIYCLISTQGFILKVALMPALILFYAAMDIAIASDRKAGEMGRFSISEIGLAPVFVLLMFLLFGASLATFAGPPAYSSSNTSVLRHIMAGGTPFRSDISAHLAKICNIQGVIEPGNVCTGDQNMPSAHYQEFAKLLAKWQADEADFLTFHPADTLLSATLRKPNALPVSFSYTDGFSPALFRYILDRSEPVIQSLRTGRALIATMDLAQLNELQWALLRRIVATWDLIPVEETEHFAVYRLEVRQAAARRTMVLPDRPIKTRNGF